MLKDELAAIGIFEGLSEEKLDACAALFETTEVLMGDRLTREDDFGYSLVLILRGNVVVKIGDDVVNELSAGDHFGEVSLLEHKKRTATVVARETCRIAKLMTWDFDKLLAIDPVIKERLDAAAAARQATD